ncbi:STAS domain-containing protein [Streptomyces sp. MUM 178J]|uniref:STAS domain-containing protein n=1 Tax=Streptomyces sp. MUM 178J TaxID=2791991 RepID=UPI001F03D41C|nr:STAS domain-containing protein [Streptomyces sp. MUM 178J]WRQ81753.1 STAS domain-containing protein [Streptomyces sp. MUM 178J]
MAVHLHVDAEQPIVIRLEGTLTPADPLRLCRELSERLAHRRPGGAGPEVICDASGLVYAGLAAVDAVARLRLAVRREGGVLRLRGAGPELGELLKLFGLGQGPG